MSFVVLDRLIVPQTHIQEVSLLLGELHPLNHTRMHQITTSREVNNLLIGSGLSAVTKQGNTGRCLQETLMWWHSVF